MPTNNDTNNDLKASFRRRVENDGQVVLKNFYSDPSVGYRVSSRPQGHPKTGAHTAYISALAIYVEQHLGAKIEIHEWTNADGHAVTTFSLTPDSLA